MIMCWSTKRDIFKAPVQFNRKDAKRWSTMYLNSFSVVNWRIILLATSANAESTKLRIKYEASAKEKEKQPSLSDCLSPGPPHLLTYARHFLPTPVFIRSAHSCFTSFQIKTLITSELKRTLKSCFVANKWSILWTRWKTTVYNWNEIKLDF